MALENPNKSTQPAKPAKIKRPLISVVALFDPDANKTNEYEISLSNRAEPIKVCYSLREVKDYLDSLFNVPRR